jgi:anhydro-N-acetylmuramic acid kinase
VPVLYDVRAADLSHGGHGAPLAPVLDRLLAGARPTAFLNLGGISNASLIDGERILAGDLGPANALIDALVLAATGEPFDRDGALAARGTVHRPMLEQLLADPYLTRPLPKSTGREYFDGGYVRRQIGAGVGGTGAADVLPDDLADQVATLTEFTARCVADALASAGHDGAGGIEIDRVIGSGGGMDNPVFRDRLAELLAPVPLLRSEDIGVPSGAKEALLMAVIGYLSAHGMPAVPASAEVPGRTTTGATPAILGSLTPPVPLDGLDPCSTVYPRALRVMT